MGEPDPRCSRLHPPRQYPDDRAYRLTEEFIAASNREEPNEVPDPRGREREPTPAAEFPNAVCRNHGLNQFPVRSLAKCYAVTLWHVIAHNFQRMLNLGVLPI
jgi:hypothetical protein